MAVDHFMTDDAKKSSLKKTFRQFTFGDDEVPLTSAPAEQKPSSPATIDKDESFTPYHRPKNDGMSPEDFYNSGDNEDGLLWDHENDGEFNEVDPLYDWACHLLPIERPEIITALQMVSNIDHMCLITARVIEDELRGKLKDSEVDSLTAAAILLGAENYPSIIDEFELPTIDNVAQYSNLMLLEEVNNMPYSDFSASARRFFIASHIARLEAVDKSMDGGLPVLMNARDMGSIAADIMRESRTHKNQKHKGDHALYSRAVDIYNRVSDHAELMGVLILRDDKTVTIETRDVLAEEALLKKLKKKANQPRDNKKP